MSVPCPYNVQFDDVTFRCSREYGHGLCHTFHNESRDFEKVKKRLDDAAIYKEYYRAERAYHLLTPDAGHDAFAKTAQEFNEAREAVRKLRGE